MKYDFLDSGMLSKLAALPVEARAPMTGTVAGRHRSPHRGSSVEFAEYRKYVPGDDVRRLDWKAYARSDRFYVKEFEADTNLRAYFVVDASGSMNFADGGLSKFDFAKRISAALSYLLINQGDAAGLCVCAEKLQLEIPPSRKAAHLDVIFSALANTQPTGTTGLAQALHVIAEKAKQRAFVVVISDFFVDLEELHQALQHLHYRKHDASLFHLLAPTEISFNVERTHRFVDLEDRTSLIIEPTLVADFYRGAMKSFMKNLQATAHKVSADYKLVVTDAAIEPILRDFLTARLPKSKR